MPFRLYRGWISPFEKLTKKRDYYDAGQVKGSGKTNLLKPEYPSAIVLWKVINHLWPRGILDMKKPQPAKLFVIILLLVCVVAAVLGRILK